MTDFTAGAALAEEVRRLRQSVERLEAAAANRWVVKLKTLREPYFLGQPVVLSATAFTETDGRPLVDIPITFATTWGKLQIIGDQAFGQSNTLTIRSDADGTANVILLPRTVEPLSRQQQDALEASLQYLDSQAVTPTEVEIGFQKMIQQYQWDADKQLVQAIDIYFREFSQSLMETINPRNHMLAWSYFDAMVTALIMKEDPEEASGTTVKGVGALRLMLKDWMGPWLQTYLASAEPDRLRQEMREAKAWGEGDVDFILDGIYDRIDTYFDKQQGFVDRYVGEKVVENTLREFLETDLADLPLEAQVELFPSIRAAAGVSSFAGASTMPIATRQARVAYDSFRTHLSRQAGQTLKGIQQTLVDERDNFVKGFQAAADAVQNNGLEKFGHDLDSARGVRLTEYKGDMDASHTEALKGFKNDVEHACTEDLTRFQTDIGKVRSDDLTRFQSDVGKVRSDGLTQFQSDFNKNLVSAKANFSETVQTTRAQVLSQFNSDINSARAVTSEAAKSDLQKAKDQTTKSFMEDLNTTLAKQLETTVRDELNTKVNVETLNNAMAGKVETSDFNTALSRKLDNTTFNQFSEKTSKDIATLQSSSDKILIDIGEVNTTMNNLSRDVSSLKVTSTNLTRDVSGLKTTSATLSGDVSVLKTKSDQLSEDVVRLDDSVTRVGNNTLSLKNDLLRSGTLRTPITPIIR